MPNIKGIIFDFWGVICGDLYWNWLKRNVPGFIDNADLQKQFRMLSNNVDSGEISSDEFYAQVGAKTGHRPEEIVADWKNSLTLNRELLDIIKKLKAKYKTAIISNSSDIIDAVIEENKMSEIFDEIVVSYKVKLIKPEPKIFYYALEKIQLSPDEVVYVDDRMLNVEASIALRMHGLLYVSNEELVEKLRSFGIT